MSKSYVPKALREKVAGQAQYRCGYCLSTEDNMGLPMNIEHIFPEALGGLTQEDNLWLACSSCNSHKNDSTTAIDKVTETIVSLFNPRRQIWSEHFAWSDDKTLIVGKTAIGRATVEALSLNRKQVIIARERWCISGTHPPQA